MALIGKNLEKNVVFCPKEQMFFLRLKVAFSSIVYIFVILEAEFCNTWSIGHNVYLLPAISNYKLFATHDLDVFLEGNRAAGICHRMNVEPSKNLAAKIDLCLRFV